MDISVEKIPGGFRVDGLDVRGGKCGCTSVLPCCYSWSKVKKSESALSYRGKATGPDTRENFNWGYTVRKDGYTVTVNMEDARDKSIFSGYYPPSLEDWTAKGWEVTEKEAAREDFDLWRCAMCKRLYKERQEGTSFGELPQEWRCPVCGAGKESFEKVA